ncbi:MAG: restriction endonuclease subunit S, partial [Holdemanella biformis]|uniref:restriction endonuclease subunit S n=1 Tax=Holdemanella biformis TaxID=1735 RepID=UPI00242C966D
SYYEKFDKCERCINDQIPFEIPNSWCWERLSSFCIINMGSSPKGNSINSDEKGGYEFHQGKSFFSSKHLLKSNVYTNQPTKLCPSSSVLLSVRAPVGKVNIVDRTICIGRGLASIKPFIDFEIELLYYFLTTLEPYFIDHSTGSTFKAITSNIVKECLLPVPPKNEQNRLLVAIKKIFSLLN